MKKSAPLLQACLLALVALWMACGSSPPVTTKLHDASVAKDAAGQAQDGPMNVDGAVPADLSVPDDLTPVDDLTAQPDVLLGQCGGNLGLPAMCEACVEQQCCMTVQACFQTENCHEEFMCVHMCANNATCLMACFTGMYMSGVSASSAVDGCILFHCMAECQ